MKKFKKIYLEITNRCNLACSFCLKSKRPRDFMEVAAFSGIVRRIRGHTDYLAPHVLGEPLLHPELDQLLEISRREGMQVNLTTNGLLVGKWQPLLLASPALRQINFSLHCATDQLAKTGPTLTDYLSGIFAYIRAATAQTRQFICLRLWNMREEDGGADRRRNEEILKQLEAFFGLPPGRLANAPTPGQGITLAQRVFLSQNRQFTWPHAAQIHTGSQGFCRGLRDHLAILVDGTVVPCCLDAEADIRLGNILDQPLAEILANPRAVRMRQGFSRRQVVEPLCRRCTFRQAF